MLCLALQDGSVQASSCPVLSFPHVFFLLVAPSTHKAKAVHEKRLKGLIRAVTWSFLFCLKVWRMEKRRGHKRGEAG